MTNEAPGHAPSADVHPALLPAKLGSLTLRNRLVVAPMTRVSASPEGIPTDAMADYYLEFAVGGFGLVIVEGTYTDTAFSQGYFNQPGIVTPFQIDAWSRIATGIREAGGRAILQLMHAGALAQGNRYSSTTAGPSPVRPIGAMLPAYGGSGQWPVPHEMTEQEIGEAVTGFASAALNARAAGFDGVEIHGANGYLLDQFLTGYTNQRTDGYGGPLEHRVRIVSEVVAAVRAAVGDDFVVGVRLSQTKVNDSEHRWADAAEAEAAIRAAAAGTDYLHFASDWNGWEQNAKLDTGESPIALAHRLTGLPVIVNGGMHDPEEARRLLQDEEADFVAVARGALANPDLPLRLAGGLSLEPFDMGMISPKADLDNTRRWREENAGR